MKKEIIERIENLEKVNKLSQLSFVSGTCHVTVGEKKPCSTCEYGQRNRICTVYVWPAKREEGAIRQP